MKKEIGPPSKQGRHLTICDAYIGEKTTHSRRKVKERENEKRETGRR